MRARLQHSAGMRTTPASSVADGFAKFGGLIGDYRMLSNIWGACFIIFAPHQNTNELCAQTMVMQSEADMLSDLPLLSQPCIVLG